jgi:small subunit ribosomal protein S16
VWRVVVADQRSPRDGRVIEHVGRYNPQTEPSEVVLNEERLRHWIERGAQPTKTVQRLMRIAAGEVQPPAPKERKGKAEAPAAAVAEAPAEGAPEEGAPAEDAPAPAEEPATEEAAPAETDAVPEEAAAPPEEDAAPEGEPATESES